MALLSTMAEKDLAELVEEAKEEVEVVEMAVEDVEEVTAEMAVEEVEVAAEMAVEVEEVAAETTVEEVEAQVPVVEVTKLVAEVVESVAEPEDLKHSSNSKIHLQLFHRISAPPATTNQSSGRQQPRLLCSSSVSYPATLKVSYT